MHFDHKLWLNELKFAKDELSIFTNRLSEVEEKNTSADFSSFAESFQNCLIRQKEVVDELSHTISEHEAALADYAEEFPIAIDRVRFDDHNEIRGKIERFTVLYAEFKTEFMRFIAKWM